MAHRINVLIFFVWMSYRRPTAAPICAFDARVSTMKTYRPGTAPSSTVEHGMTHAYGYETLHADRGLASLQHDAS